MRIVIEKCLLDQWNRIEDPDMNHTTMPSLFLTKVLNIYNGEKTA
jgi:hypothetical protein